MAILNQSSIDLLRELKRSDEKTIPLYNVWQKVNWFNLYSSMVSVSFCFISLISFCLVFGFRKINKDQITTGCNCVLILLEITFWFLKLCIVLFWCFTVELYSGWHDTTSCWRYQTSKWRYENHNFVRYIYFFFVFFDDINFFILGLKITAILFALVSILF